LPPALTASTVGEKEHVEMLVFRLSLGTRHLSGDYPLEIGNALRDCEHVRMIGAQHIGCEREGDFTAPLLSSAKSGSMPSG
jgi:hypothetical protein